MICKRRREPKSKDQKRNKLVISFALILFMAVGLCGVFTPVKGTAEKITKVLSWAEHTDTEYTRIGGRNGDPIYTAIRFTTDDLQEYDGLLLTKVAVCFRDNPSSVTAKICTGGSSKDPGTVVSSQVYTGDLSGGGWRTIVLDNPVEIDAAGELWIEVDYGNSQYWPACVVDDSTHTGKGDLASLDTLPWTTLADNRYYCTWMMEGIIEDDRADQTITASDIVLTYGKAAGSVVAATDGNGTLSYEVKSGDSVSVDAASGSLTINSVGETVITVKASWTASYRKASKDITVTVEKGDNPATVRNKATVKKGGNTVDLGKYVALNGAAGEVSYEIIGSANGCSLNGSVLTSGKKTGSVTVNVTVAADGNYNALPATPITVTISDTVPKTGDTSTPLLWAAMALLGLLGLRVGRLAFTGRRK